MASPSFPSTQPLSADNSPLNKRRRFIHSPIKVIKPIDNSDIEDHTFQVPLLTQLCGQTPTPHEIEAQLLQVGMRVRKSVNDGYQVSPKRFTPRPLFNMKSLSSNAQTALPGQPLGTSTFCGINIAAMSHVISTPTTPERLWTHSGSNKKRGFENDSDSDDAEDFLPQTPTSFVDPRSLAVPTDFFDMDCQDDTIDVSPLSRKIQTSSDRSSSILRTRVNGRMIAKPRSKVHKHQQIQHVEVEMDNDGVWSAEGICSENDGNFPRQIESGQQSQRQREEEHQLIQQHSPFRPKGIRWMGHKRTPTAGDFDEASFLQRREDVEMDCS